MYSAEHYLLPGTTEEVQSTAVTVQRKLNIRKRKRKQIGLQCGFKC